MVRIQLYFTMSSTLGIQLHVSAMYISHRQVLLKNYQGTIQNACGVSCGGGGRVRSRLTIVGGIALDLWRDININIASSPSCITSNMFLNPINVHKLKQDTKLKFKV